MQSETFAAPVPGGSLVGRTAGNGRPVLLLHGGPSLSVGYLDPLVDELTSGYEVAWYQQRSLEPSTTTGPYTVQQHVADVISVADALGWDRFIVAGHSWGGHLVMHVAVAHPDRLLAALAIDPLGGAGDGGGAEFGEAMYERTPESVRERARALEERGDSPDGTASDVLEYLRLVWPAYFADQEHAPPRPEAMQLSLAGFQGTWASIVDSLPALSAALPELTLPFGFVHGGESPIPVSASRDTAALIPGATVEVVPGAGHFIWHERPGAVRAALDQLTVEGDR